MKFFFIVLILFFTISAREPAVLPMKGISLDNYKKVENPDNATGFNFTNDIQQSSSGQLILGMAAILALLTLIFGVLLQREQKKATPNNILKFRPKKELQQKTQQNEEDDDDQLPKAS